MLQNGLDSPDWPRLLELIITFCDPVMSFSSLSELAYASIECPPVALLRAALKNDLPS